MGNERSRVKAVQDEGVDTRGQGCGRQIEVQAHADAMGDELPQQDRGFDLNGGRPGHAECFYAPLKERRQRPVTPRDDQTFGDGPLPPEVRELVDGGFLRDEESQGSLRENLSSDSREGAVPDANRQVHLALSQQLVQPGGRHGSDLHRHIAGGQAGGGEDSRQEIVPQPLIYGQYRRLRRKPFQFRLKERQAVEHVPDVIDKFLPFRGEPERLPDEERLAQLPFKVGDLTADRWLADTIGHRPGCRADAAVLRDIVDEFEMVGFEQRSRNACRRWCGPMTSPD